MSSKQRVTILKVATSIKNQCPYYTLKILEQKYNYMYFINTNKVTLIVDIVIFTNNIEK